MQITRLENSLLIAHDGISVQHALNSLVVYINEKQKTITIKDQSQYVVSDLIDHITVDGQQMTADNMQQLLEPLFGGVSTGNSSGNGSQDNQCDTYTKISYSDPLVFPTPQRAGHIVEVYKEEELYQTYQWSGWYWTLKAQLPNLVYSFINEGVIPTSSSVMHAYKDDSKIYLSIKEDSYADLYIETSDIVSVSPNYTISSLSLNCVPKKQKYEISNILVDSMSITQDGSDDSNQKPYEFTLRDMKTMALSFFSIFAKNIDLHNVQPLNIEYDSNFSLMATDLSVTNCVVSDLFFELQALDKNQSTIVLSNNQLGSSDIYIQELDRPHELSLEITNNTGLRNFSIAGSCDNITVSSAILDFDEASLRSVRLNGLTMLDEVLESFVKALTTKNYTHSDRNLYIDNKLNMTQDRIDRLTSSGWKIVR